MEPMFECEHCEREFPRHYLNEVNGHLVCDAHVTEFWDDEDWLSNQADLERDHVEAS